MDKWLLAMSLIKRACKVVTSTMLSCFINHTLPAKTHLVVVGPNGVALTLNIRKTPRVLRLGRVTAVAGRGMALNPASWLPVLHSAQGSAMQGHTALHVAGTLPATTEMCGTFLILTSYTITRKHTSSAHKKHSVLQQNARAIIQLAVTNETKMAGATNGRAGPGASQGNEKTNAHRSLPAHNQVALVVAALDARCSKAELHLGLQWRGCHGA